MFRRMSRARASLAASFCCDDVRIASIVVDTASGLDSVRRGRRAVRGTYQSFGYSKRATLAITRAFCKARRWSGSSRPLCISRDLITALSSWLTALDLRLAFAMKCLDWTGLTLLRSFSSICRCHSSVESPPSSEHQQVVSQ